jgi:MtN3 and saliva related transmembrane protein
MSVEILGFIAGTLVAVSLLPQVIKSWKTKSTSDISLGWSVTNLAGQIMWAVYGAFIGSYALVIMSSLTLVMALSVLYLKLRYGMQRTAS